MSSNTIAIIIVIAVIVLGIAYYGFHSKHKISYSDKQLADAVGKIFLSAGIAKLPKEQFLRGLKHNLSCSSKEALFLYGKCKTLGLISSDGQTVSKLQ